jgi:hypothetical protein
MKFKLWITTIILLFAVNSYAQIKGVVVDKNDVSALVGASVYWLQAQKGTTTNAQGVFELALPARLPDT